MNPPPFILPVGLDLDLSDGKLSLTYAGDVQLDTLWGRKIGSIIVGGDLILRCDETVTGVLKAGGKLILTGKVDADTVQAREVHIGKQEVHCRSISATEKIVVGPANLQVDILIAPEIVLDPKATGRVRIVESRNDPGPTKLRGGYTLKEFTEEYGDPSAFLAERGVTPLPGAVDHRTSTPPARPRSPVPVPHRNARRTPAPAQPRQSLTPKAAPTLPSVQRAVPPPTKPAPHPIYTEPTEEPTGPRPLIPPAYMAPRPKDPEPEPEVLELDEPSEAPTEEAHFHPQLEEALVSLFSSYDEGAHPEALSPLREWIGGRRYERLRRELAELWYDVLEFHRQRNTPPPRRVAHGFNLIHHLVNVT